MTTTIKNIAAGHKSRVVLMKGRIAHGRLAAISPAKSDSERLRELEGVVQQLRAQNQSLQQRVLGISGGTGGNQEVFGGGVYLSGAVRVFGRDNVIGQLTYGEGIGRYGHDTSAFNTDAALDVKSGATGDNWRVQLGVVYSLL